jgi:hypothetical protein
LSARGSALARAGTHGAAAAGNHNGGEAATERVSTQQRLTVKPRPQMPIKRPWVRRGGGSGTDKESSK